MSGRGRGIGLGRGFAAGSIGRGRGAGDGVGRGIGRPAPDEKVVVGVGLGRGRGRGQFSLPGTSSSFTSLQQQLSSLGIGKSLPQAEEGLRERKDQSVSLESIPEPQRYDRCGITLKSPASVDKLAALRRLLLRRINIPMIEKIMTVGIDVNHDPTMRNPSVTAMVVSLDNDCTKYYSRVVVPKPHQEMVNALSSIFVDALKIFRKKNGTPPDRIIVFRNRVGNSQLEMSAHHEVAQLLDAINSQCPELKHFTFVVVQKPISERFLLLTDGENENPPPGSVIDHTFTGRFLYDFYVASQRVQQGAGTATHYIVLYERGVIKPDLIQKFSYALSVMDFNWTGTIRVPSVCQYAHKLAFLIGQNVNTTPTEEMQQKLYYL